MLKSLVVAMFAVALLVLSASSFSVAQYYGHGYYYYPPWNPPPYYYGSRRPPSPPSPMNPYLYRLAPNPQLFRRWDQYNRMSDFEQLQRSPLNPESTLDYMLRTF